MRCGSGVRTSCLQSGPKWGLNQPHVKNIWSSQMGIISTILGVKIQQNVWKPPPSGIVSKEFASTNSNSEPVNCWDNQQFSYANSFNQPQQPSFPFQLQKKTRLDDPHLLHIFPDKKSTTNEWLHDRKKHASWRIAVSGKSVWVLGFCS